MEICCKPSFRIVRLSRAMSLRELSDVSGVTAYTISRAENGRPVKPSTAKKLCVALDVDFEAVFSVVDTEEG